MTATTETRAGGAYSYPLGLFEGYGVELEYMIVDRGTLDVRPVADALFRAAAGRDTSDVEPDGAGGVIAWSNELALHVAEIKTARPVGSLDGLAELFQEHVSRISALLEPMGCALLGTGMHPWMMPEETRLWPHENNEVYAAYDRIFGCKGHGWGNLQSTHINLPFANDEEFGRLHAATRIVLPLLPALAASTPIVEGAWAPIADQRLEFYRANAKRVPRMAGLVVPEAVFTREGYERDVLGRLYQDLEPLDPQGVLRHEWANARGCIPRFDRGSIEIRLLDIQECPLADLAIAALVCEVVRGLVEERWSSYEAQRRVASEPLHDVLLETIRYAERTRISDPAFLDVFGIERSMAWGGDIWAALLERVLPDHPVWTPLLGRMIQGGTLATRITRTMRRFPTRADLHETYRELVNCLAGGQPFRLP